MKRQHPYALAGYVSKNFWLLLIPLVRGLAALRFDFYTWAQGAGWDMLVLAVMIAAAVIRWYFTLYDIKDGCLEVKSGMMIRQSQRIPYDCICAATAEESPVHRFFGTVMVYIDTDAATGSRSSADVRLVLSEKDRARLFNRLLTRLSGENGGLRRTYRVSRPELAVFSLLFSSALSGVVLLITAMSGGTEIVGRQLEQDFVNIVNGLSDAVVSAVGRAVTGISPAGVALSITIGAGFLISFAVNLLRHINFTATRSGSAVTIACGLIVRRRYIINSRKVNLADMRQNLLMKLFGVTSVHVNCTGYGKRKNEMPVFVPICREKRIYGTGAAMDMLLPGFSPCESYISPRLSAVFRFIALPAAIIFALLPAGLCLLVYFPYWHSLIAFLTVMLEIPAVWLLFVKATAYCTTGINITADSVCAKYCRGFAFHTMIIPIERVAQIRIRQGFFQKIGGSCDVFIYTSSEHIGSHRVKNIPYGQLCELLRERF